MADRIFVNSSNSGDSVSQADVVSRYKTDPRVKGMTDDQIGDWYVKTAADKHGVKYNVQGGGVGSQSAIGRFIEGPLAEQWKRQTDIAKNFLPSLGKAIGDFGSAISHPVDTSTAIMGTILPEGFTYTDAEKGEVTIGGPAVRSALGSYMKDRFVTNLDKTIREDPAGILMDASSLMTGAGGAVRGGVMAGRKLGAMAKVANAASKGKRAIAVADQLASIGNAIDPMERVVFGPARGAVNATQSIREGVSRRMYGDMFAIPANLSMDEFNKLIGKGYDRKLLVGKTGIDSINKDVKTIDTLRDKWVADADAAPGTGVLASDIAKAAEPVYDAVHVSDVSGRHKAVFEAVKDMLVHNSPDRLTLNPGNRPVGDVAKRAKKGKMMSTDPQTPGDIALHPHTPVIDPQTNEIVGWTRSNQASETKIPLSQVNAMRKDANSQLSKSYSKMPESGAAQARVGADMAMAYKMRDSLWDEIGKYAQTLGKDAPDFRKLGTEETDLITLREMVDQSMRNAEKAKVSDVLQPYVVTSGATAPLMLASGKFAALPVGVVGLAGMKLLFKKNPEIASKVIFAMAKKFPKTAWSTAASQLTAGAKYGNVAREAKPMAESDELGPNPYEK